MRYLVATFAVMGFLLAFTATVFAATFVDDFSLVINPEIRSNDPDFPPLVRQQRSVMAERDRLQLTISQNWMQGGVRYRVSGAERIDLRIYSPLGTFAAVNREFEILYFGFENLVYNPSEVLNTYFANGRIYINHWGWQELRGNRHNLSFQPTHTPPNPGVLINMGINVYAAGSLGGQRVSVPLTRTAISPVMVDGGVLMVAEDFQSATDRIPTGTRYIWVMINDPGGDMLSTDGHRTSLAWVSLTGRNLHMGPPPTPPQPDPPENIEWPDTGAGGNNNNQPGNQNPPGNPGNTGGGSGNGQSGSGSSQSSDTTQSGSQTQTQRTPPAEPPRLYGIQPGQGILPTPPPILPPLPPPQPESPPLVIQPPPQAVFPPISGESGSSPGGLVIYEVPRQPTPADRRNPAVAVYIIAVGAIIGHLVFRPKKAIKR